MSTTSLSRSGDKFRRYRERVKNGQPVTPRPAPVELVLSDEQRLELHAQWEQQYRRCIAAWLLKQHSKHTTRTYARAWRLWLHWCDEKGIDGINPPRTTGAVFIADMKARGYSNATINTYKAAICMALEELSFDGLSVGVDPFGRSKRLRVESAQSRIPLTDEEVHRVVEAARELGGQHLTAVLLLAVLGLRAGPAGQVRKRTVQKSPWGLVAKVTVKGDKPVLVPLPQVILDAAAIDGWPADGGQGRGGYERISYLVDQARVKAGVPHANCHAFRHWHVTAALEAGVPLERVQDSVHHADPRTTQSYNDARVSVEKHSGHTVAKLPAITGVAS